MNTKRLLLKGDCLELFDTIEDGSIDLILTDPPYNISQDGHSIIRANLNSALMRRESNIVYDFGEWDKMTDEDYLAFTKDWFTKCVDKLKDGGTFISFFPKENVNYLGWIGKELEMRTRTIFTWHKTNPTPSFRKVNYLSACEFAWIGSKGEKAWTFNFGYQKDMHNFYETPNASSYATTEHPCEKPIVLLKHLIEVHSNMGDTVLDPFAGSGSTLVACRDLGRNCIGIEKDDKWYQVAKNRIEQHESQSNLFDFNVPNNEKGDI